MARKAARKHRRNETVDFDDEDSVLAEVAKKIDAEPEDCSIKEDRGLTSFGEGTVYRVECGRMEYLVVESDDAAQALAKAVVTQDLEHEPEIFNKEFLARHIDTDRLRRELEPDLLNSRIDDLSSERSDDFWDEYEREGFEAPEEDEDGDRRDPEQSEIEELAERQTEDQLRDPMRYLEDIYGDDEAVEQAMKIAGFDISAAAEDAVDEDGWQHFLSRYDGNSDETKSGFVFWREN